MSDSIEHFTLTEEIKGQWTSLLTREKGKKLLKKLEEKIKPGTRYICLDFESVVTIDKSFIDEFLVPILNRFNKKMTIIGINIDRKCNHTFTEFLFKVDYLFFGIDNERLPHLYGAKDEITEAIIVYIWKNEELTLNQIAYKLDIKENEIEDRIAQLEACRLIFHETSKKEKHLYYWMEYKKVIEPNIGKNIFDSVYNRLNSQSVKEENHFKLPSGLHTDRFYHVNKLLEDARLTRKIGTYFASIFGKENPKFVVTIDTPNNVLLAHRTAQALGMDTRSIFGRIQDNYNQKKLILHNGFCIKEGEKGLIMIDVLTTGYYTKLLIDLIKEKKGELIGICCLLERASDYSIRNTIYRIQSLISDKSYLYTEDKCDLCKNNIPILDQSYF